MDNPSYRSGPLPSHDPMTALSADANRRARLVRLKVLTEKVAGCTAIVCRGPHCEGVRFPPRRILDELGPTIQRTVGGILVSSFGCLGPCAGGKVVVVVHRRPDQSLDTSPASPAVWVAIRDAVTAGGLASWIADGGPGQAPMPPGVDEAIIGFV